MKNTSQPELHLTDPTGPVFIPYADFGIELARIKAAGKRITVLEVVAHGYMATVEKQNGGFQDSRQKETV